MLSKEALEAGVSAVIFIGYLFAVTKCTSYMRSLKLISDVHFVALKFLKIRASSA